LFAAFLGRIDKNQDMKIDWVEWRDYFDLRSAESIEEILKLWRCPPVCIAVVVSSVFFFVYWVTFGICCFVYVEIWYTSLLHTYIHKWIYNMQHSQAKLESEAWSESICFLIAYYASGTITQTCVLSSSHNASMLLIGWQEGHLACKKPAVAIPKILPCYTRLGMAQQKTKSLSCSSNRCLVHTHLYMIDAVCHCSVLLGSHDSTFHL